MCCEPGHTGAPPEWHRELAGQVILEGSPRPAVSMAEALNTLAAIIHQPPTARRALHRNPPPAPARERRAAARRKAQT